MDSEDKKPLLHIKLKDYSGEDEPAPPVQGQQFLPDWWYWIPIVIFGWPMLVGIVLGIVFGLRAAALWAAWVSFIFVLMWAYISHLNSVQEEHLRQLGLL